MFTVSLLVVGLAILALSRMRREPSQSMTAVRNSFMSLNGLILIAVVLSSILIWMGTPTPAFAEPLMQTGTTTPSGNTALAAAIAVGMATIGAGIAVAISGSAAISAVAEKPEVFGRTLIFVGLAEGIAIYGVLIAFMILTN